MVANDAMELARMCARAADDAKAEKERIGKVVIVD